MAKAAVKKPAKKAAAKKPAKKSAVKKATRKVAAKKATRKVVAKKATRKAVAKKGARKVAAKKTVAKKTVAKKAAVKKKAPVKRKKPAPSIRRPDDAMPAAPTELTQGRFQVRHELSIRCRTSISHGAASDLCPNDSACCWLTCSSRSRYRFAICKRRRRNFVSSPGWLIVRRVAMIDPAQRRLSLGSCGVVTAPFPTQV